MPAEEVLLRFVFQAGPVRGGAVRLTEAWREVADRHALPAPVLSLLGQTMAAAALLAASLKFNGALILQIHGDGPVRLLVVECQPDLSLRATAKVVEGASIGDHATMVELVNAQGRGRCAITLDPLDRHPGQQPYQGVVPLDGDSMAQALESYLRQSEQIDSRLWLAADRQSAAGLLLQRLPGKGSQSAAGEGEVDEDLWDRLGALAGTVSAPELLATPPEVLLRRLFWQEPHDRYEPRELRFKCRCSRQRIGRMLLTLGREEVDSVIAELGLCTVTCDFCNTAYAFDAIDVAALFNAGTGEDTAGVTLH